MLTVQSRALVGLKRAVGRDVSRSGSSFFCFLAGLLSLLSLPFWWMMTAEALRFYLCVRHFIP
jgi:hypothetical protein